MIEAHEWDMRTHEGVRRWRELKARSLPAIAINGELVFQAMIPLRRADRRNPEAPD
jgi:hypothetical protein